METDPLGAPLQLCWSCCGRPRPVRTSRAGARTGGRARRHWGVETSHQILDTAFEEDDHPWIEACPRAALVVAILRRIAYTMLALFRTVTQRSEERRATPWQTLMTDLFVALISTTDLELREPKPLRLR